VTHKLSPTRAYVRKTVHKRWEWTERWGPQLGDTTEWSVRAVDGGAVTIARGSVSIDMSRDVMARVAAAFAEITASTEDGDT
jgi:hypothetical protein